MTVAHVYTVAFQGIEAREVDVQVHIAEGGNGQITIVGLADKAVAESRERVRAALSAIGLALPYQRITVNLAPADLPKEGSYYDLPIALGLLAAMGVIPASEMAGYVALGELSLDAAATGVAGVLNAALAAREQGRGLICPSANGPEAAFAGYYQRSWDHFPTSRASAAGGGNACCEYGVSELTAVSVPQRNERGRREGIKGPRRS